MHETPGEKELYPHTKKIAGKVKQKYLADVDD